MEKAGKEITVEAVLDNLDTVLGFVEAGAKEADCPEQTIRQLALAIEELYVNVANYAYVPDTGPCVVGLQTGGQKDTGGWIRIWLKDSGEPFDPLAQEPPDITLSAEERQIGGLGIFMAGKLMDRLDYRYENGENILSVEKRWQ